MVLKIIFMFNFWCEFIFTNFIRFEIAATKMTQFWRHVVLTMCIAHSAGKAAFFARNLWLCNISNLNHVDYSTKFGDQCRNVCKHISSQCKGLETACFIDKRQHITKEHRQSCWSYKMINGESSCHVCTRRSKTAFWVSVKLWRLFKSHHPN